MKKKNCRRAVKKAQRNSTGERACVKRKDPRNFQQQNKGRGCAKNKSDNKEKASEVYPKNNKDSKISLERANCLHGL